MYGLGITVKQADVILLGYPLMMNMSKDVLKNDLMVYEQVIYFVTFNLLSRGCSICKK